MIFTVHVRTRTVAVLCAAAKVMVILGINPDRALAIVSPLLKRCIRVSAGH